MKCALVTPLPTSPRPFRQLPRVRLSTRPTRRLLHPSPSSAANPLPVTQPGPPPTAPLPAASHYGERVDRRRRQAELIRKGQEIRTNQSKPANTLKKRFWKDVSIRTSPGMIPNLQIVTQARDLDHYFCNGLTAPDGAYTILLDSRPVRNPQTKVPLPIPPSKSHLATAIAHEWDLLTSAQQALRAHLTPLTSIASRAHDLVLQDAATASSEPSPVSAAPHASRTIREDIVETLLPYLDTDTLLCWAPPPPKEGDLTLQVVPSLRDLQVRAAEPIVAYLTSSIWPGVQLNPSLEEGSILPSQQPAETRAIVRGWMSGLNAWELVGLERAVLAGKSLCVGARLICEWGESFKDVRDALTSATSYKEKRFGIEEAAQACSLEVAWQTGRWGEVEDTHDVDKEDLRSQFGSAILAVSGTP
ncbi:MAG: hypothetical protein LQ350_006771 [Teloschistes chrysophthalmus]|nr:MAG: hypothetical protein LQ350_006771 [Niorma chrysophthalma]